mgnify:FL=1
MDYKEYALGKTPSLKKQVYDTLRMKIVSGELLPGARLHEEGLCGELGVSRAPLREAMNMLDRDGFVRIIPRRGAVVTDVTPNDIEMLWNIRILLEPNAAVMAMDNIPEKKVLELREMLQRVENDPSDFVRYMESDIAVHALFVDYLDNRYLKDILRNLKEHSMRMRWNVEQRRTAESVPVILESTKEHMAIIQAVEDRQSDALYDAVMKHLIDSKFRTMNISNEKHVEFETNGRKATLNFMHITKVKVDK